jgi:hypothetical protein
LTIPEVQRTFNAPELKNCSLAGGNGNVPTTFHRHGVVAGREHPHPHACENSVEHSRKRDLSPGTASLWGKIGTVKGEVRKELSTDAGFRGFRF